MATQCFLPSPTACSSRPLQLAHSSRSVCQHRVLAQSLRALINSPQRSALLHARQCVLRPKRTSSSRAASSASAATPADDNSSAIIAHARLYPVWQCFLYLNTFFFLSTLVCQTQQIRAKRFRRARRLLPPPFCNSNKIYLVELSPLPRSTLEFSSSSGLQ